MITGTSSTEIVVELRGVHKRFGPVTAVENLALRVRKSEILALLGPSGCGKTTTLRMIAGFERPDQGQILIDDVDVVGKRPYERNIGLVFQSYALFPHMTIAQNLAYGMRHRGVPRAEMPQRAAEILRLVKLEGYEDRRPSQLSGGQQQRVALARALVTRPALMLLDEPLSNLDARLRQELRVEIKQILAAVGTTTIVVTHDQEEAMTLSDRIAVMNRGRIEQEGEANDVYHRPATRFVADFMGSTNWLSGLLARDRIDTFAPVQLDLGPRILVSSDAATMSGKVVVGVRPERLLVTAAHTATDNDAINPHTPRNRLDGVLEQIELLGANLLLWVRLSDGCIVQALRSNTGSQELALGMPVHLRFGPADAILLSQ